MCSNEISNCYGQNVVTQLVHYKSQFHYCYHLTVGNGTPVYE